MTKQERIKALEEILAKIRSGSTCYSCTPLTRDVKTDPSLYSGKPPQHARKDSLLKDY